MHADGLRLFEEQMKHIQEIIHGAKIIVMTLDGYLQVAAGDTQMSTWMQKLRVHACIVDEAHQLAATLTAPLTMKVDHLLLVWDRAQKITYSRQVADLAQGAKLQNAAEKYPWAFALYGGTFEAPWEYLPEYYIFDLTVTWRFGPGACDFINATCKAYKPQKYNLVSPEDQPRIYSEKERKRVPDTIIRFVVYRKTFYYGSRHRGAMEDALFKIHPATSQEEPATHEADAIKLRVAGNKCVFTNLLHEGLTFLGAVLRRKVRMNDRVPAVSIDDDSKAIIATMFYANDVIVCFQCLLWFVATHQDIQKQYGIPGNIDIWKLWKVGTPEALSGADVFLAQVVVIPRNTDQADVRGNLQDEGRRTVASTRGRKLLSYHMEENCFAAVGGNYCWHDHWKIVCNKNWKGRFKRQDRIVDANYTEQLAAAYLGNFLTDDGAGTEARAFQQLWDSINDLRVVVHRTRQDSAFKIRWKSAPENASLLEDFLVVTEGYIAEIDELQEREERDDDRESAPNVLEGNVVDPLDEPVRCTHDRQAQAMSRITHAWFLRFNLLRSASWYASGDQVQVTPLLLVYHTREWDKRAYEEIVDFQRLIVYIAVCLWTEEDGVATMDFVYIPHKVRRVGIKKIYDCSGSRTAMATIDATVLSGASGKWTSYSYVGGGVPTDPPNVYGLVSRYMPRRLAIIYLSIIMLISGGEAREYMFIRKRKLAFHKNLTQHEEAIALERARDLQSVQFTSRRLKETYSSAEHLYADFFAGFSASSTEQTERSRTPRRQHR